MNKQFMYVNGTIIVSDNRGMKPAISYVDNIEDILILENEIEFLELELDEDRKKLESKKKERDYRNRDSKKISIVGSIMAVGISFGMGQLAGLSHEEMTNTIMGSMSEYMAYAIPMSVGCIGFVQALSLLGLSYRPSKKDINGLEQKIIFEKEMIKVFRNELECLKSNPTYNRKDMVEQMVSYDVHDKYSLDYLREALKLRYTYGYEPDKIMKLFEQEELYNELIEKGFSDDVIMDFLEFVKSKMIEKVQETKFCKK